MIQVSITSTESFAARAQKSEARRVVLWLFTLAGMAIVTIIRRMLGGVVMSSDRMFYPTIALYGVAIAATVVQLSVLRRAIRQQRILPRLGLHVTGFFDVCVVGGLMAISAVASPRGAVPALSAPTVLLFPVLILLSVLRLKPNITLATGLTAAAFHAALAAHAVTVSGSSSSEYPVYFAYACILLLTGVAGMVVARDMRTHVQESLEEAEAHERAERSIALVNRDLSVARDIQRGLLPAGSPAFAGFDIAGLNTPAAETGGDYYDWQELPDGRLVTVLADVSGHGIGPAIVMAVCRAYARASAHVITEPTSLMSRLNDLLHADLPADRFITLAISLLSPDGNVELLSAGHGPSLLFQKATNHITQFGGNGLPLGVYPHETYGPTASIAMKDGDVLVMLTDGFFEWHRARDEEQFGIPRLQETLLGCADKSAGEIISTFDAAVRRFAEGSPQLDDMTILVIKRTA